LAFRTQHLLSDPRVSLFIAEPDKPGKNPLSLQRINLQGHAEALPPAAALHAAIKERYLQKFPQSQMMFGFGDFGLWELRMQEAHLVLGFGQAYQSHASDPSQWRQQRPEKKV
jgi:putative heme iron utilization protein